MVSFYLYYELIRLTASRHAPGKPPAPTGETPETSVMTALAADQPQHTRDTSPVSTVLPSDGRFRGTTMPDRRWRARLCVLAATGGQPPT
ncbi:MAG: hypothetical protein J07HX5_00313 [halophilic archaeon J07HX5]|nr:MAG: hypothetical protein J07HX5_00313 [halophilic archaeon J07HX5]